MSDIDNRNIETLIYLMKATQNCDVIFYSSAFLIVQTTQVD